MSLSSRLVDTLVEIFGEEVRSEAVDIVERFGVHRVARVLLNLLGGDLSPRNVRRVRERVREKTGWVGFKRLVARTRS